MSGAAAGGGVGGAADTDAEADAADAGGVLLAGDALFAGDALCADAAPFVVTGFGGFCASASPEENAVHKAPRSMALDARRDM